MLNFDGDKFVLTWITRCPHRCPLSTLPAKGALIGKEEGTAPAGAPEKNVRGRSKAGKHSIFFVLITKMFAFTITLNPGAPDIVNVSVQPFLRDLYA